MKARFFTFLGLLSVALGGLTSCTDAIFATIETEKKVATNTLPLLMSVLDIASPAGGTYYVAAGAVFQGILPPGVGGTVTWNPDVNTSLRPWNPPGLICNAMVYYPVTGTLWGGFITSGGSPSLYQSSTGPDFSFANSAPTAMLNAGEQVTLLRSAGPVLTPYLFLGGATAAGSADYVYELDYSTNGTTWLATSLTGLLKPIAGVGYDATKNSYWAATGSTIYSSTSPALPFTAVPDPGVGSDLINGLFVDSTNGVVFIATKTRGVFFTKDGGATWTRILAETPPGSSNPASFLTVAGPVDVSAVPPNDKYLVGSDGTNSLGFGYYTLSLSASTLTRFPDTTILLYSSSVSRILVDTTSTPGFVNVLMGTNFNGLWRGVFDPTTGQILSGTNLYWIHE